jgi:hypothetical protein
MMSGFSTDYNQVLLVCVHGARNLRKADVIGSSDAYAVIKFPVEGASGHPELGPISHHRFSDTSGCERACRKSTRPRKAEPWIRP